MCRSDVVRSRVVLVLCFATLAFIPLSVAHVPQEELSLEIVRLLHVIILVPFGVRFGLVSGLFATAFAAISPTLVSSEAMVRENHFQIIAVLCAGGLSSLAGRHYRIALASVKDLLVHREIADERLSLAEKCGRVGLWDWYIESDDRYWSPGYYQVFGEREDALPTSDNFLNSVHPDDLPRVLAATHSAMTEGEYRIEYRLHPSRGERWILAVGRTVKNSPGKTVRLSGVVMDITERKAVNSALRTMRQRYRVLAENVPVGVVVVDAEGRLSYANRLWTSMTGQLLHKVPREHWLLALHQDDRPRVSELWNAMLKSGAPLSVKVRLRCASQSSFKWHLLQGVMLDNPTKAEWLILATDVTHEHEARAALERLGDNLPEGAIFRCITYPEGVRRFTYVSAGVERICGLTPQEALDNSESLITGIPAEDWSNVLAAERRARETSAVCETEFRHRAFTGEIKWVLYRAKPEPGPGGAFIWDGVLLDITQRKRAEASLQVSEERFRLASQAVTGVVYDWDLVSGEVHRSDGLEGLIGVAPKDARRTPDWWMDRIHPDDLPRARATLRIAFAGGTNPVSVEYRIRHQDGRWITVWDCGHAVTTTQGEVVRLVGCATDISEPRRMRDEIADSERRFKTLADMVPQLVWCARADGTCEYLNERWYAYTGITKKARISTPFEHGLHSDDSERAGSLWRQALELGTDFECEFRLQSADEGVFRWFIARAVPIRDDTGKIVRWFGTCTDVDDQKRFLGEREALLESERAARSEAERASRSKDQFVAILSHELRAPLHAILGWTQMMRRGRLDEKRMAQALEVVERNTRVQAQLISDLLDINRIVSGKLRLSVEPVDVIEVVETALQTIEPAVESKGIAIELKTPQRDDTCLYVMGDPSRLQQIVWNLLSNAVKFTPKNGRIQVAVACMSDNTSITVTDSGHGIDPEFLPRIFERFSQAGQASVRAHGGLGLGLSIVKHLVELHGGTVRAVSEGLGRGASFTVELPTIARGSREQKQGNYSNDLDVDLSGKRVLVVDDEADSRLLVQNILADAGAEVLVASGANEALELLCKHSTDVIVSDIGMPDKDGYSFLRELRGQLDNYHQPAAVALTAFAREEDRMRSLAAGFTIHLSKPVEANALLAAVEEAISRDKRPSDAPGASDPGAMAQMTG